MQAALSCPSTSALASRISARSASIQTKEGVGRQPVRASIETGGEVQHGICGDGLDAVEDHLVKDRGAHRKQVCEPVRSGMTPWHGGHPFGDPPPTFSRQLSRERVAEQGVGSLGFHGTAICDPARRIGDVFDQGAHGRPPDCIGVRRTVIGYGWG